MDQMIENSLLDRLYRFTVNYHWVLVRVVSVTVYYVIGVWFYHTTEDWTVIDSVYFVTVSVATIGYGDFHPTSDNGRLFTGIFLIAGLIFVLSAVEEFARFGVEMARRKVFMTVTALILLALTGVVYFTTNEGWTGPQAFYWTVTTMTTVGYGDLPIKNSSTRLFSIFFIACCVVVYATTVHNVREYLKLSSLDYVPAQAWDSSMAGESSGLDSGDIEMNPLAFVNSHAPSLTSANRSRNSSSIIISSKGRNNNVEDNMPLSSSAAENVNFQEDTQEMEEFQVMPMYGPDTSELDASIFQKLAMKVSKLVYSRLANTGSHSSHSSNTMHTMSLHATRPRAPSNPMSPRVFTRSATSLSSTTTRSSSSTVGSAATGVVSVPDSGSNNTRVITVGVEIDAQPVHDHTRLNKEKQEKQENEGEEEEIKEEEEDIRKRVRSAHKDKQDQSKRGRKEGQEEFLGNGNVNNKAQDVTLYLLALVAEINANSALVAEVANLRKKYELIVPRDDRIKMTKKELRELLNDIPVSEDKKMPRLDSTALI